MKMRKNKKRQKSRKSKQLKKVKKRRKKAKKPRYGRVSLNEGVNSETVSTTNRYRTCFWHPRGGTPRGVSEAPKIAFFQHFLSSAICTNFDEFHDFWEWWKTEHTHNTHNKCATSAIKFPLLWCRNMRIQQNKKQQPKIVNVPLTTNYWLLFANKLICVIMRKKLIRSTHSLSTTSVHKLMQ